jgi:hypothetical protein
MCQIFIKGYKSGVLHHIQMEGILEKKLVELEGERSLKWRGAS